MKTVYIILIAAVTAIAGFFAGYKFQTYHNLSRRADFAGQFQRRNFGGPNTNNRQNIGFGRPITGEITSFDDNSVTIKMHDGSTKIVIVSKSTSYTNSSEGSKSDLKLGVNIGVFGSANSDGTLSAQNIQINPVFRAFSGAQTIQNQ